MTLLDLWSNRGVGAAQNAGIAWARERDAAFLLLSAQDSIPAQDMVARLLAGFARAVATRLPVAAVGPITVDKRNGDAVLLFSEQRWGPRRAHVPDEEWPDPLRTSLLSQGLPGLDSPKTVVPPAGIVPSSPAD